MRTAGFYLENHESGSFKTLGAQYRHQKEGSESKDTHNRDPPIYRNSHVVRTQPITSTQTLWTLYLGPDLVLSNSRALQNLSWLYYKANPRSLYSRYVCIHIIHVCMYVCMYVCMHVMYAPIYVREYICIYIYTLNIHIHVHMYM